MKNKLHLNQRIPTIVMEKLIAFPTQPFGLDTMFNYLLLRIFRIATSTFVLSWQWGLDTNMRWLNHITECLDNILSVIPRPAMWYLKKIYFTSLITRDNRHRKPMFPYAKPTHECMSVWTDNKVLIATFISYNCDE